MPQRTCIFLEGYPKLNKYKYGMFFLWVSKIILVKLQYLYIFDKLHDSTELAIGDIRTFGFPA